MKKFNKHGFAWMVFLFAITFALNTGCEKNTTAPSGEEAQLSAAARGGLQSGWQTIHSLGSVESISEMVGGEVPVEQSEMGGIYSRRQLKHETDKMKTGMKTALSAEQPDGVRDGDSLVWFIDWTDPVSGVSVRKAFYYDQTTGHARYYEAIYRFPSQVQLEYDSTEIRADLNFTLNDSTDDKVKSLSKLSRFKEGFHVKSVESEARVTDYGPNNEVTGAEMENTVLYGSQSALSRLSQQMKLNPDESGSITERLDYRDNTFLSKTVNFYSDYTGDFSEIWRNGTTVNGTFDRIEDDNHASFSKTITFPAGNNPQQIEQAADVTLNPADSSSSIMLSEKIKFAGGRIDSSRLNVEEFFESGLKKTHLEAWHSSGAHSDLLVSHFPEYDEIEGDYTGPLGYFTLIHALVYSDGSGELWLTVYQSEEAYQNGETPLAEIYIHYNPDGSGDGRLTENDSQAEVELLPGGEMVVKDSSGRTETINGY